MMTILGFVSIASGVAWIAFDAIRSRMRPSDDRATLFAAYTLLSDHIAAVGTPEQKQALMAVLPAIASRGEK